MSRNAYYRNPCPYCGKEISNAGSAAVAHKRKHVREGLLIERRATYVNVYTYDETEAGKTLRRKISAKREAEKKRQEEEDES